MQRTKARGSHGCLGCKFLKTSMPPKGKGVEMLLPLFWISHQRKDTFFSATSFEGAAESPVVSLKLNTV